MASFVLTRDSALQQQVKREDFRASVTICLLLLVPAVIAAGYFNAIGIWFVVAMAVLTLVYCEPRIGLYLVVLMAAIDVVPYDPIMLPAARLGIPLPGALATPVELLFLWTVFSWLLKSARSGEWFLPNKTALVTCSLFSLCVVIFAFRGAFGGGSFTIALWETRALLLILPTMMVAAGLITERRHVFEYVGVVVASQALMGAEQMWRYLALIRPALMHPETLKVAPEAAFNHDGAVLVAVLSVIGAALIIWGNDKRIGVVGIVFMVVSLVVVLGSRRRAAIVGAEVGIVLLAIILMLTNWRRFAMYAPVAIVFGILYIGVFWNSQNSLGQPVRAFRSVFESSSASARDKSSDYYRDVERADLWLGIRASPLTGVGFGVPFPKPIPLQDLSKRWPFWAYIPHNNILWLWNKGGILTFATFFYFIGTSIASSVSLARQSRDPTLVALIATILAFYVMVIMFAWVDLGLSSSRMLAYFGTSLGLLSVLDKVWWKGRPPIQEEVGVTANA